MARHANRAQVYSVNGERLRSVSLREAYDMKNSGDAVIISSRRSSELKIQLQAPRTEESRRNTTSITFAESQANAGLRGRGFNRMSEDKVMVWPYAGDDRAVCVRPRPVHSPRQARRLAKLLRSPISR